MHRISTQRIKIVITCLALCLCGCTKYDPGYDFKVRAMCLKDARDYWLSHGRPTNFQLGEVVGPPEAFFIYTNILTTTNGVFHCRFGSRDPGWPPGTLAITDEGLVIYIRERDGKVFFSPEDNGVEY
jgi:hypothetical protein